MFVTSRNSAGLSKVVEELKEELRPVLGNDVPVAGFGECNVSSANSVARLASLAQREMGTVDVWINNAGYSGTFQVGAKLSPAEHLLSAFRQLRNPGSPLPLCLHPAHSQKTCPS